MLLALLPALALAQAPTITKSAKWSRSRLMTWGSRGLTRTTAKGASMSPAPSRHSV